MKSRLAAFGHALRGLRILIASQPHAKIHLVATALVLLLGFILRVTAGEWALLILAIAIVWLAEALNTALEFLADEVTLERRDRIKHAKDIAAFAVLAASIGAAVIGALVFVPHLAERR